MSFRADIPAIATLAIATAFALSCGGADDERPAAAAAPAEPPAAAAQQPAVTTPRPSAAGAAEDASQESARSVRSGPGGEEATVTPARGEEVAAQGEAPKRVTSYIGLSDEVNEALRGLETIEIGGRIVEIKTRLSPDAIPSIDEPTFISVADADDQLDADSLVIGLSIGEDHRAYGVAFLTVHEIVNDVVGGRPVAITY